MAAESGIDRASDRAVTALARRAGRGWCMDPAKPQAHEVTGESPDQRRGRQDGRRISSYEMVSWARILSRGALASSVSAKVGRKRRARVEGAAMGTGLQRVFIAASKQAAVFLVKRPPVLRFQSARRVTTAVRPAPTGQDTDDPTLGHSCPSCA
jgi:hypothetical protein